MRCVTREPIATTSLPRELMTQKRWVDVEDFATDSEREAIDGDEPEPEIGWRASLDVWPQLCSRTLVVQVIVCDMMDALSSEYDGLLWFCCKLALFVEIWTSGLRTLEIRKFPPLRNHAVYYTSFAANLYFSLKSGPVALEPWKSKNFLLSEPVRETRSLCTCVPASCVFRLWRNQMGVRCT